jgi:TadE-like protein
LLIFMGAVDYSRVFYVSVTVANCARNGALYASNPTFVAFDALLATQAYQ